MMKMKRLITAQYIALGATICSIIGFLSGGFSGSTFGEILLFVGCLTGFISYFFGGMMTAFAMSWRIAKWGWYIVPFPYDLTTFAFAFIFAGIAFVFLPIIPIRKAYKEAIRE